MDISVVLVPSTDIKEQTALHVYLVRVTSAHGFNQFPFPNYTLLIMCFVLIIYKRIHCKSATLVLSVCALIPISFKHVRLRN